jgi:hypothetical protein
MRQRPRPGFERVEVAPILAHPDVHWKQGKHELLVQQEPVRLGDHRRADPRPELQHRADAS